MKNKSLSTALNEAVVRTLLKLPVPTISMEQYASLFKDKESQQVPVNSLDTVFAEHRIFYQQDIGVFGVEINDKVKLVSGVNRVIEILAENANWIQLVDIRSAHQEEPQHYDVIGGLLCRNDLFNGSDNHIYALMLRDRGHVDRFKEFEVRRADNDKVVQYAVTTPAGEVCMATSLNQIAVIIRDWKPKAFSYIACKPESTDPCGYRKVILQLGENEMDTYVPILTPSEHILVTALYYLLKQGEQARAYNQVWSYPITVDEVHAGIIKHADPSVRYFFSRSHSVLNKQCQVIHNCWWVDVPNFIVSPPGVGRELSVKISKFIPGLNSPEECEKSHEISVYLNDDLTYRVNEVAKEPNENWRIYGILHLFISGALDPLTARKYLEPLCDGVSMKAGESAVLYPLDKLAHMYYDIQSGLVETPRDRETLVNRSTIADLNLDGTHAVLSVGPTDIDSIPYGGTDSLVEDCMTLLVTNAQKLINLGVDTVYWPTLTAAQREHLAKKEYFTLSGLELEIRANTPWNISIHRVVDGVTQAEPYQKLIDVVYDSVLVGK